MDSAEDPILDFAQINSELALFDPDLANKPQIVVFNKIDIPEVRQQWEMIDNQLKKQGYHPMAISGLSGENVRQVLYKSSAIIT